MATQPGETGAGLLYETRCDRCGGPATTAYTVFPEKQRLIATLAEWIRQCKLTGLYAEGKTLFEKGGLDLNHLSEETAVNVEEDYMVCLRLLFRADGQGKK
ncbi:MAG: hypothetical protein ACOX0F_13505 [Syntrophomonadaceae bacterium]